MTERDFEIVSALLFAEANVRRERPIRIVEWGSGRSTISLTSLLHAEGVAYQWLSLDNDAAFVSTEVVPHMTQLPLYIDAARDQTYLGQIREALTSSASRTVIVCFDRGPLFPAQRGPESEDAKADLDDYVELPARVMSRVDFVLVDGRKRRRCVLEASQLIGNLGIALLHDAYRRQYQCAFSVFAGSARVGDELWIGHNQAQDVIESSLDPSAFARPSSVALAEGLSGWSPPTAPLDS